MTKPTQSFWDRSYDITTPLLNLASRFTGKRIIGFFREKWWNPFTLRRVVFFTACASTLIALFYSVENWRGKSAWEKHKREMAAQGVNLDWDSYVATNQYLKMKSETKEIMLVRSILQRSIVVTNHSSLQVPLFPYSLASINSTWPPEFEDLQRLRKHSRDELTRERLLEFGGRPVVIAVKEFKGKSVRDTVVSLAERSGLSIDIRRDQRSYGTHLWFCAEMFEGLENKDSLDLLEALLASTGQTLVQGPVAGVLNLKQDISLASLHAWFDLNRPWVDAIFDGLKAKGLKLDVNLEDPLRSAIPNFVAVRTLTQTLNLGAQLAVVEGDPDEAIRYVRRILELTSILNDGHRSVVGTMIQSPSTYMAGLPIGNGLQAGIFQPKHLAQLKEMFGQIDLIHEYVRSVNEGERLQMVFGMERFSRDDLIWMFGNPKLVDEKGLNWFHVSIRSVPRGWIYQNLLKFDETTQMCMDTIHKETGEVDTERLNQYAAELGRHEKDKNPYFFLAGRSIINHQRLLQTLLMHQAAVNELVLACALEEYRLEHGEYPEKLNVLMPKYLAKIPKDVIDGKPMRYRREARDSFVLYSIGWNRKDEGGTVKVTEKLETVPKLGFTFYSKDRTQGDWVFRSKPLITP